MSLTPDLVELCWRAVPDQGRHEGLTPLSPQARLAAAERLAAESAGAPLHLFAYGSLIWKPAFEAVDRTRATAHGWHRAFCMELLNWRGSRETPGLMMALDRGGRCDGVVYRLPDTDRAEQIATLLEREIDSHEDLAAIRWVRVRTERGDVRALCFWIGIGKLGILRRMPLDQVAPVLARACGHMGSCAEYLYNTVVHLEAAGIRDRNLWRLQRLVAAEIRAIHGI